MSVTTRYDLLSNMFFEVVLNTFPHKTYHSYLPLYLGSCPKKYWYDEECKSMHKRLALLSLMIPPLCCPFRDFIMVFFIERNIIFLPFGIPSSQGNLLYLKLIPTIGSYMIVHSMIFLLNILSCSTHSITPYLVIFVFHKLFLVPFKNFVLVNQ